MSKKLDKRLFGTTVQRILNLEGYKPVTKGGGAVQLVQDTEFSINRLIFSYHKTLEGYSFLYKVSFRRTVKDVEKILRPYYTKHKIGYEGSTLWGNGPRDEAIREKVLKTIEDVESTSSFLREQVFDFIIPEIESMGSLQDISDRLQACEGDYDTRNNFLAIPQSINQVVIYALTKPPNWQDKIEKICVTAAQPKSGEREGVFSEDLYDALSKGDLATLPNNSLS